MSHPVSNVIARAAHAVFGRPLLHYDFVTIIIEAIVADALGPSWRWQHGNGEPGAFNKDGLILRVKHFEALDHHAAHANRVASWIRYGSLLEGGPMVQEDLVILAHHGEINPRVADHRDPAQWDFYVLDVQAMPIGIMDLRDVERRFTSVKVAEVAEAVARVVAEGHREPASSAQSLCA